MVAAFSRVGHSSSSDPSCGTPGHGKGEMKWVSKVSNGLGIQRLTIMYMVQGWLVIDTDVQSETGDANATF